jgi:hypothetical protein
MARAEVLNSLWARQVKERAQEDAQMILTGLWPVQEAENGETVNKKA